MEPMAWRIRERKHIMGWHMVIWKGLDGSEPATSGLKKGGMRNLESLAIGGWDAIVCRFGLGS
jgi:hypothetical protein